MFRIDSAGATAGNRFTIGDPGLSIPATVVSDEILNSFQEEIIKPIEQMGITLAKANEGQLWESLLAMFLNGGRKSVFRHTLLNNTLGSEVQDDNNTSATLSVDRSTTKLMISFFDIERKTSLGLLKEFGLLFLSYDSKNNAFLDPKVLSLNGDGETTFKLIQEGATDEFRLNVDTEDLAGTSYDGVLDLTSIIEIKQ